MSTMKHLTPGIIADVTGGKFVGEENARDVLIKGAVRDDRDVKPGDLFVCIKGARVDGHSFANNAFESGAVCCLAEQPIPDAKGAYVLVDSTLKALMSIGAYHRDHFNIPFIGVTGSVGKTTAKELIASVLGVRFKVLKTSESFNNDIGVNLSLISLDESHEIAVIEMGISDFGDMSRLANIIRPDVFVMTSIGYAHLFELVDLQGVLRAKTEAFAYMKPDGVAVMNGDDELLLGYETALKRITFGLGGHNDFRAENICAEDTDAVTFDIVSESRQFPARIPAYGVHLASLAASAAAVGSLFGMSDDDIREGILSYAPVGGRSNVTKTGMITLINDSYNANPNSVKAALMSLSALRARRVAILGDMIKLGNDAAELHQEVGAFAARSGVDSLICCGEEAIDIYKGYLSAGGSSAFYYRTKSELIPVLPELIKKSDAVLVKASRGMEFEEIVDHLLPLSI